MVVILDDESLEELKTSVAQVQVDYQTKELYMVANVIKYRSVNLIILYCCTYSGLSGTAGVVFWNSIGLMRNAGLDPQVDG